MVDWTRLNGQKLCINHTQVKATWFCTQCNSYRCPKCVVTQKEGKILPVPLCSKCNIPCQSVVQPVPEPAQEKSFIHHMLEDAFLYPFQGHGVLMVLLGWILLIMMESWRDVNAYAAMGTLVGWAYFGPLLMEIMNSSSRGDKGIADWVDPVNLWEEVLEPLLYLVVTIGLSFAPAILYGLISPEKTFSSSLMFILLLPGLFYFPMASLGVFVTQNLSYCLPNIVLPSITRTLPAYLLSASFFALAVFIRLFDWIVIGGSLNHALMISLSLPSAYLLIVSMRIMGLFYLHHKDQLNFEG